MIDQLRQQIVVGMKRQRDQEESGSSSILHQKEQIRNQTSPTKFQGPEFSLFEMTVFIKILRDIEIEDFFEYPEKNLNEIFTGNCSHYIVTKADSFEIELYSKTCRKINEVIDLQEYFSNFDYVSLSKSDKYDIIIDKLNYYSKIKGKVKYETLLKKYDIEIEAKDKDMLYSAERYIYKIYNDEIKFNNLYMKFKNVLIERNIGFTWQLFVFARSLIRSFFTFHGEDEYYDNLLKNKKVSILEYLEDHDFLEIKANNWLVRMRKMKELKVRKEIFMELSDAEKEENIKFTSKVSEHNYILEIKVIEKWVHLYEANDDKLTKEECEKFINDSYKKSGVNTELYKFYSIYPKQNNDIKAKIQSYVKALLTNKDVDYFSKINYLQPFYQINLHPFLSQPHYYLTKYVHRECRKNHIDLFGQRGGGHGGYKRRGQNNIGYLGNKRVEQGGYRDYKRGKFSGGYGKYNRG
ncbi:hypothetical protein ACQ4LE_002381 [Meloidogyne hapla]